MTSDSDQMQATFELLQQIEARPEMFIGSRRLQSLELFLRGYLHALPDESLFLWSLSDYLRARFGWSMSCGPLDAIRREVGEEQAWDRFFELVHEFRAHLEARSKMTRTKPVE